MKNRPSKSSLPKANDLPAELRLLRSCPLCQKAYNKTALRILLVEAGSHLAHVTCKKCQLAMLAVIVFSTVGMSSIAMVTDLNVSDVERLKKKNAFESDDVLDFHRLMSTSQEWERMILG